MCLYFVCLILCLAYSNQSGNVCSVNRQSLKHLKLIGIFAIFLCFYFVVARDCCLAFIPPPLWGLTNYLKSLLPKRPVTFAPVSWQDIAPLVRTAASELSAIGSQGRVWMAWGSPSTLLENGSKSPALLLVGQHYLRGKFSYWNIWEISVWLDCYFCRTFFPKLHNSNKSKLCYVKVLKGGKVSGFRIGRNTFKYIETLKVKIRNYSAFKSNSIWTLQRKISKNFKGKLQFSFQY